MSPCYLTFWKLNTPSVRFECFLRDTRWPTFIHEHLVKAIAVFFFKKSSSIIICVHRDALNQYCSGLPRKWPFSSLSAASVLQRVLVVFLTHNKFRRSRWDQRPFYESSAGYDCHCNTSNQAVPANNFHHHFLRFSFLLLLLIPASNFHHHFGFDFYCCSYWFFSEIFAIWLLSLQQFLYTTASSSHTNFLLVIAYDDYLPLIFLFAKSFFYLGKYLYASCLIGLQWPNLARNARTDSKARNSQKCPQVARLLLYT